MSAIAPPRPDVTTDEAAGTRRWRRIPVVARRHAWDVTADMLEESLKLYDDPDHALHVGTFIDLNGGFALIVRCEAGGQPLHVEGVQARHLIRRATPGESRADTARRWAEEHNCTITTPVLDYSRHEVMKLVEYGNRIIAKPTGDTWKDAPQVHPASRHGGQWGNLG